MSKAKGAGRKAKRGLILRVSIYATRHPGRDCRDPVAMDGKLRAIHEHRQRHPLSESGLSISQ
ncbi:hypothetical protein [Methylobacter sp.]